MELGKFVATTIVMLLVTAALILVIPNIPPNIEQKQFIIKPPRRLEGWFVTNSILDEAELYFEKENAGFESIAIEDDNCIYSGDQLGNIIKVTGKQVATNITTLKFPCNSFGGERGNGTCGWPLGMRFDKRGYLYTMDYFGGLTKVNVKTGTYENINPKSRPIQDKFAHVPEDHDIDTDRTIYWTDGSTVGDFFVEMIGEPSGRLIKYDPVMRKNEVLLENLHMSNGVCLSEDEKFVLVSETGKSRILRYHIAGDMKGQTDIFVDALPGYPDNIRSNGRGGFYVALFAPWNDEVAQNEPILNLSRKPKTATIVELSKSGEILGVLNGKSGKVSIISQISVGTNYAFLVSPFQGKIWRIKLNTLRRMH